MSPCGCRVSLLSTFEWMTVVLCAFVGSSKSTVRESYRFDRLPTTDSTLENWYRENTTLGNVVVGLFDSSGLDATTGHLGRQPTALIQTVVDKSKLHFRHCATILRQIEHGQTCPRYFHEYH